MIKFKKGESKQKLLELVKTREATRQTLLGRILQRLGDFILRLTRQPIPEQMLLEIEDVERKYDIEISEHEDESIGEEYALATVNEPEKVEEMISELQNLGTVESASRTEQSAPPSETPFQQPSVTPTSSAFTTHLSLRIVRLRR